MPGNLSFFDSLVPERTKYDYLYQIYEIKNVKNQKFGMHLL